MNYFEQHLLPEERNSIPFDFISKQYGKQIALSDENQEIRYDYLEQRIACRRHKLQSMNLKAGTNIGLYDVNSIDEVEWFLAVTTAGLVAVMIPSVMTEDALEKTATHYELGAIIAGTSLENRAAALGIPIIAMSAMDQEGAIYWWNHWNAKRRDSESWSDHAWFAEWGISKRNTAWTDNGSRIAIYPCVRHDFQHAVRLICRRSHSCM